MEVPQQGRVLNATAEFLGVSRRWLVKEAIPKGKVPFLRPPGSRIYLFLESDLCAVLQTWRAPGNYAEARYLLQGAP